MRTPVQNSRACPYTWQKILSVDVMERAPQGEKQAASMTQRIRAEVLLGSLALMTRGSREPLREGASPPLRIEPRDSPLTLCPLPLTGAGEIARGGRYPFLTSVRISRSW